MTMQDLVRRAERAAAMLKERRATVVVAESSTGGLISAALLALPGASSYFLGGAVVYTKSARASLLDIPDTAAALLRYLGAGGDRRDRPDRKPLWRSARSQLYCRRRRERAGHHAGNRQCRPLVEHVCIQRRRARSSRSSPRVTESHD